MSIFLATTIIFQLKKYFGKRNYIVLYTKDDYINLAQKVEYKSRAPALLVP